MSEHNYERHSKTKFIITGPKDKYSNISKQVGGVWKKAENGWVINDSCTDMFKKLLDVIHPDNDLVFEKPKEAVVKPVVETKPKRKFRRARSITSNDSDSIKEVVTSSAPYTGNLNDDSDDFQLTSSSSDSDSSADYPHSSPNRKKLANDDVMDKMETLRRRMFELDMADRRKKKSNT
jgi:hypothetical protein